MSMTGDTHLFRTLVDLDDPVHMKLRALTQAWFMPPNSRKLETRIAEIAKEHVDHMASLGGECDFVKEVALWYPLRVIMEILGVPRSDEKFMLKMTQEIFGPSDPDVAGESENKSETGQTVTSDEGVDLLKTGAGIVQVFRRHHRRPPRQSARRRLHRHRQWPDRRPTDRRSRGHELLHHRRHGRA
jgi:cytochrome P450